MFVLKHISMYKKYSKQFFTAQLLQWNQDENKRLMPWKGEKDPYKIWLSEIILQQTRVEQGLDYYNRFITKYPTVEQLAAAPGQEVFKLWEGLGYYTRCKNLISTANFIVNELKGKFPETYEGILNLKGIGPYTAAAIGSFAFGLPYAVVDGNVFRVLARYFGIGTAIDSVSGKKNFSALAEELLAKDQPGVYNQALMDFGAVVCKPQLPLCHQCPLNKKCVAFLKKAVSEYPVKEKQIRKRTRWFYYALISDGIKVLVKKRGEKDIWENLNEFVLIEKTNPVAVEEIVASIRELFPMGTSLQLESVTNVYKQQLTHQTICGQFLRIKATRMVKLNGYEKVNIAELDKLPFPKFITNYLKDKTVSLNLF